MKNILIFLSENFRFLDDKFSIYLNRRVFVMTPIATQNVRTEDSDQTARMSRLI